MKTWSLGYRRNCNWKGGCTTLSGTNKGGTAKNTNKNSERNQIKQKWRIVKESIS